MAKYYVRISDEKPLPSDKGITFELITDSNNNSDSLLVLSDSQYNSLIDRFGQATDEFEYVLENDSEISNIISTNVINYLSNMTSVPDADNATNATYVKGTNANDKYSYSDLKTALDSKASASDLSDLSTNVYSLSSEMENKASISSLSSYSLTTHKHAWVWQSIGDYGNLWINSSLNMAFFNWYQQDRYFKKGKEYSITNIGNIAKPKGSTKLSCYNPHLGAYINISGTVYVMSDIDGTMNLNMSGMFII